ncbi:hypothetical protein EPUS_03755 [Endocarpon pusillum Z07020]|uniref:Ubiquitin-like domain-containing protein n=1 Tax=Endocarpon pusillum (strain Z07020 / HMAS-L-300199) TaxID=1263415 RepID=U1FUF7_ENDPU|nr:uncharacterized protein EPUS_03755 [Endocarpon pusillum Z07020]ERF68437.1 hypothetical protein EPUS_03755 [Endocarpon pusillum Z07020]
MTPAFGFSVGDFIQAITLIKKVCVSLRQVGGASTEYQHVIIELQGLGNALQQLQALEPTDDNFAHVNAIRAMALACQLPLREFMTKLEKYESALGPFAERSSLSGGARKAKWAVSFAKEVERLRVLVAAKCISINMLLASHTSQTISQLSSRSKKEHEDLMTDVTDTRAGVNRLSEELGHLSNDLLKADTAGREKLEAVFAKADATQASIARLRSLGEQVMGYVGQFPKEIREFLRTILQSNWQIYRVLLQVQQNISHSPTGLLDSNIKFEDALGEYKELPYEYFRHWEPFEGFLRAQFKSKPGEEKILNGFFHIIDPEKHGAIVKKEHWSRTVKRGASFGMSIIISHLQRQAGCCPRPGCLGLGSVEEPPLSFQTCDTCHLTFYPVSSHLTDNFNRVTVLDDDENVQAKQTEEDLRLYGSRIEPPEVRIVDKGTKRSASEFETLTGRSAKASRTEGSNDISHQVITAMDWNSGASPLDAWLNQSAVPSADSQQLQQQQLCKASSTARELDEIKAFRNVHITDVPQPVKRRTFLNLPDEVLRLGLQAQIYYRNILDRYPQLPTYLVCRLAVANHCRAERLRHPKIHTDESADHNQNLNLISDGREQEATSNSKNSHKHRKESPAGRATAFRQIPQRSTKAQHSSYIAFGEGGKYQCAHLARGSKSAGIWSADTGSMDEEEEEEERIAPKGKSSGRTAQLIRNVKIAHLRVGFLCER